MIINHNIAALNTYRQLSVNNTAQQKSLAKLSSGLRINSAADDAAGLAISEKMRAQVRGLEQASRNAQDGISMLQTAEGALNEVHSILQRMRELATQSASDTNTNADRQALQDEVAKLKEEIDRIGNTTEFNTQKLLDGSKGVTTTSADLTGGVAVEVSASNEVRIIDNAETQNNTIAVTYNVSSGNDHNLILNIKEGIYDDPVEFAKAFNQALQDAAKSYDDLTGESISSDIANFSLGFDIDTDTNEITFYLKATSSTTNSLAVKDGTLHETLANALGLSGSDITVTGNGSGVVTTNFTNVSKSASGTEFKWGSYDFIIKVEDGIEQDANQNNELKMTFDGLDLTGYVAEGNYADNTYLASAVYEAIIGYDVSIDTSGKWSAFASGQTGANWVSLVSAAKDENRTNAPSGSEVPTGLIAAVNNMTEDELKAKGYNGNLNDMQAAYFADLVGLNSDGTTDFRVEFNTSNKMEISAPAEMQFDEDSQVANLIGMTDVNTDISKAGVTIHIGANAEQTLTIGINDMRTTAIGKTFIEGVGELLVKDIDISTEDGAQNAIKILDTAISEVSSERSKIGAYQNRLEHTINNLGTSAENLTAAESRIRDVDMAEEMMEYTKMNILSQAAQAMLAQANQLPQGVLQLLR